MQRPLRLVVVALIVTALLAWTAVMQLPDRLLHVIFLDVDGGQGVLLCTPSGRWVLIDGGRQASVVLTALGRYLPFWQRTLHATIATNQADEALLPLIDATQRYYVLAALGTPAGSKPSAAYRRWRDVLREHNVLFADGSTGTTLDVGDGVYIQVASSANGHLALRVSYDEISILLAGPEPASIPTAGDTILAFPASPKDNPPVHKTTAQTVIILNGRKMSAPPTIPILAHSRLFSTAADGSIEVTSDGREVWIRPVQ